MLLAELEIRHSRAIAPTRRVALGDLWLPTEPAPGFGGILLAGILAGYVNQL
ncbi:MAG: rRNA (guanine1516-N2)-methyltransferase, partial [Acidimicrobiaceae bacterium]|nr:rRNA (guanine1516-N2)-methyltransferase [Acidimicrobiaceae bacterium]